MIPRTTMMMVTLLMLMCGGVDGMGQDTDGRRNFSPFTKIVVVDGKKQDCPSRDDGVTGRTTLPDGRLLQTGRTDEYHVMNLDSLREDLMNGLRENDADIFVMLIDKDSRVVWTKVFGGTGRDVSNTIKYSTDGSILLTGATGSNDGTFGKQGGAFVMSLDLNGNIIWKKTFGSVSSNSIINTSDGGILITGFEKGDILIMKLDKNGETVWKKTYGGSRDESAYSISTQQDDSIVLTGETESNDGIFAGMHKGNEDIFVMKLDKDGVLLWTKTFGGDSDDYGRGINTLTDGSIVVTGRISSNNGDFKGMSKGGGSFYRTTDGDIFVMKLDKDGEIVWKKTYGGSSDEWGEGISSDSNQSIRVRGRTSSTNFDFEGIKYGDCYRTFYMLLDKDGNLNPTTNTTNSK